MCVALTRSRTIERSRSIVCLGCLSVAIVLADVSIGYAEDFMVHIRAVRAMEHAADSSHHAVLTGKAPKGAVLEARRVGSYLTSPVDGVAPALRGPRQRTAAQSSSVDAERQTVSRVALRATAQLKLKEADRIKVGQPST